MVQSGVTHGDGQVKQPKPSLIQMQQIQDLGQVDDSINFDKFFPKIMEQLKNFKETTSLEVYR